MRQNVIQERFCHKRLAFHSKNGLRWGDSPLHHQLQLYPQVLSRRQSPVRRSRLLSSSYESYIWREILFVIAISFCFSASLQNIDDQCCNLLCLPLAQKVRGCLSLLAYPEAPVLLALQQNPLVQDYPKGCMQKCCRYTKEPLVLSWKLLKIQGC